LSAFFVGAIAGYGVAIPLGPIGVLIVQTGLRRGLRAAAAAGAGAATADLVYATVAMIAGSAAAALLAPVLPVARVLAVIILVAIVLRSWLPLRSARPANPPGGSTYFAFLGLTLLNPLTVIYFVSLVVALPEVSSDFGPRAAFVAGAFLASLSWQQLLAVIGALLHGRLSERAQRITAVASALIILGLAVRVLVG
jgi:threonine/homoserine/homoserine lactone efflux protein